VHPMTDPVTASTPLPVTHPGAPEPELVAEDLVEEISIDGMCGVY
jgi:mycofactocin precursor